MSDDLQVLSMAFYKENEAALETQLGMRLAAASVEPRGAALDANFAVDAATLGVEDDFQDLGRRLYVRLSKEMHQLLCGDASADAADRDKIKNAIGIGDGLVAVLTGILVSSFGLMPAIGAIIAALLAKRIFVPAGHEVCAFWATKLPK